MVSTLFPLNPPEIRPVVDRSTKGRAMAILPISPRLRSEPPLTSRRTGLNATRHYLATDLTLIPRKNMRSLGVHRANMRV